MPQPFNPESSEPKLNMSVTCVLARVSTNTHNGRIYDPIMLQQTIANFNNNSVSFNHVTQKYHL